jgi:hypothetical protein
MGTWLWFNYHFFVFLEKVLWPVGLLIEKTINLSIRHAPTHVGAEWEVPIEGPTAWVGIL